MSSHVNVVIAGAYESYFSDHRPVYFMLHNKNEELTRELLCKFEPDWPQISKPDIQAVPLPLPLPLNINELFKDEKAEFDNDEDIDKEENADVDNVVEILGDAPDQNVDDDNQAVALISAVRSDPNLDRIGIEIMTPFNLLNDLCVDWFIEKMVNPNPNLPFAIHHDEHYILTTSKYLSPNRW